METDKSKAEEEQKDLAESWDWASAIAEGYFIYINNYLLL